MARLPMFTSKDGLTPEQLRAYESVAASRGSVPGPFQFLLNNPGLCTCVGALGAYVRFEGGLDKALQELAILVTGRHFDAQFEWTYHVPLALKAGVRQEVVAAVRDRMAPAGLSPDEALVFRYVQELLEKKRISKSTFAAAMARFGKDRVLELTATVGHYSLMSMLMNAFELEPHPGVEPLKV